MNPNSNNTATGLNININNDNNNSAATTIPYQSSNHTNTNMMHDRNVHLNKNVNVDDVYGPVAKSMMMEMLNSNPTSPTVPTKARQMMMAGPPPSVSPIRTSFVPQQMAKVQPINIPAAAGGYGGMSSSYTSGGNSNLGNSMGNNNNIGMLGSSHSSPTQPRRPIISPTHPRRTIMQPTSPRSPYGKNPSLRGFDPLSFENDREKQQQRQPTLHQLKQQLQQPRLSIDTSATATIGAGGGSGNPFDAYVGGSKSASTSPVKNYNYRNITPTSTRSAAAATNMPVMNQQQQQNVYPFPPTQLTMMNAKNTAIASPPLPSPPPLQPAVAAASVSAAVTNNARRNTSTAPTKSSASTKASSMGEGGTTKSPTVAGTATATLKAVGNTQSKSPPKTKDNTSSSSPSKGSKTSTKTTSASLSATETTERAMSPSREAVAAAAAPVGKSKGGEKIDRRSSTGGSGSLSPKKKPSETIISRRSSTGSNAGPATLPTTATETATASKKKKPEVTMTRRSSTGSSELSPTKKPSAAENLSRSYSGEGGAGSNSDGNKGDGDDVVGALPADNAKLKSSSKSRASKTFNKFLKKASSTRTSLKSKTESFRNVFDSSGGGGGGSGSSKNKTNRSSLVLSPKKDKNRRVSMPETASSSDVNAKTNAAGSTADPSAAVAPSTLPLHDAKNDTSNNNKASDTNNNDAAALSSESTRELMEMKDDFGTLQIPSLNMLAKQAPTSFLTGKTDEVVRTSEYEPSPYQLEIPSLLEVVTIARLNEFVNDYRKIDQNLDLSSFNGLNRMELQQRAAQIPEHTPIVQSILECGDNEISIEGFVSEVGGPGGAGADITPQNSRDEHNDDTYHPDDRLEAVIFHGSRYFVVVFRGTTDQQSKILGTSKSKKRAVPIDDTIEEMKNVEVYSGFKDGYTKLERRCFTLLDKLTEEHPFCDVMFTGYSYGAAMATLGSFRYATARPMMRVGCITLGSPKVGFSHFRHVVNSLPNLKVMRIELGQDSKCEGPSTSGWHVGHTLVLTRAGSSSSSGGTGGTSSSAAKLSSAVNAAAQKSKNNSSSDISGSNNTAAAAAGGSNSVNHHHYSVGAYRFETPKYSNHKFWKVTNPDLKKYISTLEDMSTFKSPWVKDFVNISGEGVVVNNESRQVV